MFANISIHRLISYYLMSSYLYYEMNTSVLSDGDYDELCKCLLKRWKEVESSSHIHKHLIDKESLESGSGFAIQNYPQITKGAARDWLSSKKPIKPNVVRDYDGATLEGLF